jgi:hypothetical protein
MVMGCLTFGNTLKAWASYRTPRNSESNLVYKRELIETACKTAVVFSVYAALYAAHFLLHHPGCVIAVAAAAFIVHPLAAAEATGIIYLFFGMNKFLHRSIANTHLMREIEPQLKRATEQARQEGFQVPDQWWALSRFSRILHQTGIKKCQEIFHAILKSENRYDAVEVSYAEIEQLELDSLKFLGRVCLSVVAACFLGLCTETGIKRVYDPLDLNEKIKNFSIRLTSG